MLNRIIATLLILGLAGAALADSARHPLAQIDLPAAPTLGLDLDRLDWGGTTLSYSMAWSGGRNSSLGLLTKDLRIPLGETLNFNTRFGLAFSPNTGLDGEAAPTQLVLPYAALDWRPSEHIHMHLEYSRGGTGLWPDTRPLGYWSREPFERLRDEGAESP